MRGALALILIAGGGILGYAVVSGKFPAPPGSSLLPTVYRGSAGAGPPTGKETPQDTGNKQGRGVF